MEALNTMAEGKKSFVVYTSWKLFLEDLTNEQLGAWFKWVMDYCNDLHPEYPQDQATRLACKMTQDILKRDLKKYEIKVESINKAREKRKYNIETNIENNNEINNEIKVDSSSVNVNVNDNVNVNVNDSSKEENKNNRDINISCPNRASIQTLFDTFWSAYPRKTGKEKCLKWFNAHKPDAALVNKMVDTIAKFKDSKQWSDPQYIPYPYTWLNRGGWDDELDKKQQQSSSVIDVEWETLPELTDEDYEKLGFKKY